MTAPNADQTIQSTLAGQNSTGGVLGYQFNTDTLGRTTLTSGDDEGPYTTEFTANDPVVGSAASYDQIRSTNLLQGSRHIDPRGNLVTPKKAWLVQWYWLQDGAPTPLPFARLQQYLEWADVLRPWSTTAVAAFKANNYTLPASEGQPYDYSSVATAATLDEAVANGPAVS